MDLLNAMPPVTERLDRNQPIDYAALVGRAPAS
jgi:hypothetical protein